MNLDLFQILLVSFSALLIWNLILNLHWQLKEFLISLEDGEPLEIYTKNFRLQVTDLHKIHDVSLQISSLSNPNRILWQNKPGLPFIQSAIGNDSLLPGNGEYRVIQNNMNTTVLQTLNYGGKLANSSILFTGQLLVSQGIQDTNIASQTFSLFSKYYDDGGMKPVLNYELMLSEIYNDILEMRLRTWPVVESDNSYDRVIISFHRDQDETPFGLGEQFSHWNLTGLRVPIITREQGIGRGRQPVTYILNNISSKNKSYSGGDSLGTYSAIGHYITSKGRSVFLHNSELSFFDFSYSNRAVIETCSMEAKLSIFASERPLDLVESFTKHISGRMKKPVDWALKNGAVIGIQGGERKVFEVVTKLKQWNIKVAAVWLQDWVGSREQILDASIPIPLLIPGFPGRDNFAYVNVSFTNPQKRLWWNWEHDLHSYPNWRAMIKRLHEEFNVKVMAYINPFLTDVSRANKPNGSYAHNYFQEASDMGYLVKQWQQNEITGEWTLENYLTSSGPGIYAGIIDITNPGARKWYKDIIKTNMIDAGVSGWMADFGEYIPFDAIMYTNRDDGPPANENYQNQEAMRFHNIYPLEWAKLNHEVVEESGRNDIQVFLRSMAPQSPSYSSAFWQGDQLHTWDNLDGLESTVHAQISSSLSGYAYTHSDIGGYTTLNINPRVKITIGERTNVVKIPILERRGRLIRNDHELFERWMEVSSIMSTSLFRTHEGSAPGDNIQIWDNELLAKKFGFFTQIFLSLYDYRQLLSQEYENFGHAPVRPLFLHFNTSAAWGMERLQFLLGPIVLVIPVTVPKLTRLNQKITDVPLDDESESFMEELKRYDTRLASLVVDEPVTVSPKELPKPLHGRPYLPKGKWLHVRSSTTFVVHQTAGQLISPRESKYNIPCKPGDLPVFIRIYTREEMDHLILHGLAGDSKSGEDWKYWLDGKQFRFVQEATTYAWTKYMKLKQSLRKFTDFLSTAKYPRRR